MHLYTARDLLAYVLCSLCQHLNKCEPYNFNVNESNYFETMACRRYKYLYPDHTLLQRHRQGYKSHVPRVHAHELVVPRGTL